METKNQPYLLIIVPVYNAEKYLKQCVDSILSQSFKDYELWLIDDGSKDQSIDMIKAYAEQDARINTAFIHGAGPAVPRNYGLRRATGKYILFIDSDDYLPENALQTLVDKTYQFPTADFIRGNQRILVNEEREATSVFAEPRAKYADKIIPGEEFMVNVLDKDYAPIDALIRYSFLKDHNIEFHEELVILEDGPFIIEIMANGAECVYINEETYIYRLGNPDSVTNSKKSFPKSRSLVQGSAYNKQLADRFNGIGRKHIMSRSVDTQFQDYFKPPYGLIAKKPNK